MKPSRGTVVIRVEKVKSASVSKSTSGTSVGKPAPSKPQSQSTQVADGVEDVSAKGKDIAKEPFVPDEYWKKKAPQNATPGSNIIHYRDYNGKTEKSTVIYDDFGRQKYRIDHSDHSMPKDHSVPHLHEYKYGPGYHPVKGKEFRYNFWR